MTIADMPFFLRIKVIDILPFVMLLVLIVSFYAITPMFLSHDNILVLLAQGMVLLLVGTASTFPILMGSIDLSVAANTTLSGIVVALFIPNIGVYAALSAILVGLGFGLINGLASVKFKLPSFIITLGTMSIMDGTGLLLSGGSPIWFQNDSFAWISKGNIFGGLQNIVIWSIVVYALISFLGSYTRFGRYLVAIGGGERIAKLSGINVEKYRIMAFTSTGLLCGIAGILQISRVESASPHFGATLLMDSIASVVIGGTPVSGGVGGIHRTFIGVLVITVLSNGLDVSLVHPYLQLIIKGIVVLSAVILTLDRSKLALVK
jgi:ribose transport system permease protein/putative xylitol transport system permease protein